MYPFYLELELIKPVSDFFKNQGYRVMHEIKIGFCRADLVGFKDDRVVAVELKLSDWKKAIVQMKNYQLGSDYVYLCVPLSKSYNIIKKAEHILKKEGIGLLVVNEKNSNIKEIIYPKKSKKNMGSIKIDEIKRKRRRNYNKKRYFK